MACRSVLRWLQISPFPIFRDTYSRKKILLILPATPHGLHQLSEDSIFLLRNGYFSVQWMPLPFIEAYDIEFTTWVKALLAGAPDGPSSWDGYVACVTADALIRSRQTGQPEAVELMEKPALYR